MKIFQVQVASDEKLALMSRAGEALARVAELERQLQDARARHAQLTRDRERDVSVIFNYFINIIN